MSPRVVIQVIPGSLFCMKVLTALEYKQLEYELDGVHPGKLKTKVPHPHLVPVMRYDKQVIPDSREILRFIDKHHKTMDRPLYPIVELGQGAADDFGSVENLEKWAHDELSMLYYYWGGVSRYGRANVTRPFVKSILPKPVAVICACLPAIGARAGSRALLKRIKPLLGEKTVSSDENAREALFSCLRRLEAAFKTDDQQYLYGTPHPTAADFAVFAPLKRFLHPLPDVAPDIGGGYPNVLKDAGNVPRLTAFFDRMDKDFYQGKIDWTEASKKI